MLARGLAGVQLSSNTSLIFAYCSLSFEKYTENLKILGKYEKKKAEKMKGHVFSLFAIGNVLGFAVGIGKENHVWQPSYNYVYHKGCLHCRVNRESTYY